MADRTASEVAMKRRKTGRVAPCPECGKPTDNGAFCSQHCAYVDAQRTRKLINEMLDQQIHPTAAYGDPTCLSMDTTTISLEGSDCELGCSTINARAAIHRRPRTWPIGSGGDQ